MLSELGILISSVLLSVGGLVALVGEQCRRSRCTRINCSDCCQMDRDVESPRPTRPGGLQTPHDNP